MPFRIAGIDVHITAFPSALVIHVLPHRWLIRVFFAFFFTPAVLYNVLFHAGATAVYGVYCPGLLTVLTVYPPCTIF